MIMATVSNLNRVAVPQLTFQWRVRRLLKCSVSFLNCAVISIALNRCTRLMAMGQITCAGSFLKWFAQEAGPSEKASQRSLFEITDDLFNQGKYEEAIELLTGSTNWESNFESLWRLSYAKWSLARIQQPKSMQQMENFAEALQWAEKAYQLNPDHYAAQKMMGLSLTECNMSSREKLTNSSRIFSHLKAACDMNPTDPQTHYFFGSACFVSCVIPGPLKSLAGVFVTLPSSTFEEALQHFSQAEKLKPGFMCRNQYAMAKTYEQLGRYEEAVFWMKSASQFKAKTIKDERDKNDAETELQKWSTQAKFKPFL